MRHHTDFDLSNYNSYRIKAICKNVFFPESEKELQELFISRKNIPKIIMGGGYNVILSKPYYEDDFIIFQGCFNDIQIFKTTIEAGCGVSLRCLSEMALSGSLAGLEMFYDIPGSVGGAVVMNAGACGEEIKDIVTRIRYFDIKQLDFFEITNRKALFGYRSSCFQEKPHLLITRAWFRLFTGNKNMISEKMEKTKQDRWQKQPREHPNAGSVFKRPPGHFVGSLIDELGLKGFRIGGAAVSQKHSGFIVNCGDATGADIIALIQEIRRRVRDKFGIDLVLEQKVL